MRGRSTAGCCGWIRRCRSACWSPTRPTRWPRHSARIRWCAPAFLVRREHPDVAFQHRVLLSLRAGDECRWRVGPDRLARERLSVHRRPEWHGRACREPRRSASRGLRGATAVTGAAVRALSVDARRRPRRWRALPSRRLVRPLEPAAGVSAQGAITGRRGACGRGRRARSRRRPNRRRAAGGRIDDRRRLGRERCRAACRRHRVDGRRRTAGTPSQTPRVSLRGPCEPRHRAADDRPERRVSTARGSRLHHRVLAA